MPLQGTQQAKGKAAKPPSTKLASGAKTGPTWTAPKTITHPEHHHTLNHLNQVAAYYAVLSSTSVSSSSTASISALQLQSELTRSAKTLSRKAVIRLDTSTKRGACGRCDAVLVEGLTMSVRSKASGPHDHLLKKKCGLCGTVVRVPAPNLVPRIEDGGTKRDGAIVGQREEKSESATAKQKSSQRQRRRIGSIKRQLLRESQTRGFVDEEASSTSHPSELDSATKCPVASKPKLSRGQRRQARVDKLQHRSSSQQSDGKATTAPAAKRRRRDSQLLPSTIAGSNTALDPVEASGGDDQLQHIPRYEGRAQRPQLPHFNDRVQGSGWDEPFTKLSSHLQSNSTEALAGSENSAGRSATKNEEKEVTAQALDHWQIAARSRGDHLLVSGVGKNGSLGASVS